MKTLTEKQNQRMDLHLCLNPDFCSQKSSQKADEYLREIKEQRMLGEAVIQCVEAAAHEYDTSTQKALLRVSLHL